MWRGSKRGSGRCEAELSCARNNPVKLAVQGALSAKKFKLILKAQEEAFRHTEIATQPQVKIGIHPQLSGNNPIKTRGFDTQSGSKRSRG